MRDRQRIVQNLESLYRDDFEKARKDEDRERMARLDFEFQRDQLYLEVLLDVRDLLLPGDPPAEEGEGVSGLLERAQKLRKLTRLR